MRSFGRRGRPDVDKTTVTFACKACGAERYMFIYARDTAWEAHHAPSAERESGEYREKLNAVCHKCGEQGFEEKSRFRPW